MMYILFEEACSPAVARFTLLTASSTVCVTMGDAADVSEALQRVPAASQMTAELHFFCVGIHSTYETQKHSLSIN